MKNFIGSANNQAPFNENDIELSEDALKEIGEKDWGEDKPEDRFDDDEDTFQVIPREEPVKSDKTNDDGKEGEDPNNADPESPDGEQPKGDGDEGDVKAVSYDELIKDLEEGTQVEVIDPVSGEKVHLSKLMENHKKVMDDHENDENWQKTNTEKSQKLADERSVLDKDKSDFDKRVGDYDAKIGAMDVEEVLKTMSEEHFLEEVDKYFDGEDKNPIRKVLEAVGGLQEKHKTAETEREAAETKYADEIDKEIKADMDAIIGDDESYKDDTKMNALSTFAGENRIKLPLAKKVMEYDTMKTKNEELATQNEKLSKELKERNELVKKLRAMPGVEGAELEPDKHSQGPSKENYSEPADGWDEAEKRVNAKVGL